MIRVGILGYGFAGRGFHAYLLTHEPRLKLTAVATRDAGRRAQAEADYGVRTFETLEQLLSDGEIDLVIIATPHALHAQQAIAAMDAGKHVVCEKVMCLTGEEAAAMIAARDRNGVVFSVFHNRRWDGDFLTVRNTLAEGLLGTPRFYEIGLWRYGAPRTWRGRKADVGSLMHDWGAHFIDQMFQLVPSRIVTVTARAQYDWPDLNIESYLGVDLLFDNGTLYRMELSNRARFGKPHWYILGDRGALTVEGVDPQETAMLQGNIRAAINDPALHCRVATLIAGTTAEMRLKTIPGDWTAYYRNLADVIYEGAELAVRAEDAQRGVLLLQAIERSLATGCSQRLEAPL